MQRQALRGGAMLRVLAECKCIVQAISRISRLIRIYTDCAMKPTHITQVVRNAAKTI
jgi:hypothetical protein